MSFRGACTSPDVNAATTSLTLGFPPGTAVGDSLIVVASINLASTVTITIPGGTKLQGSDNPHNNNDGVLLHKVLTQSDITAGSIVVSSSSAGRLAAAGVVLYNLDPVSPIYLSAYNSTSGSSATAPSITTQRDGSDVIVGSTTRADAGVRAVANYPSNWSKDVVNINTPPSGASITAAAGHITTAGPAGEYGGILVTTDPPATELNIYLVATNAATEAPPPGEDTSVEYLYDDKPIGSTVALGDDGVSPETWGILYGTQTYVAGIHGTSAVRCYSPSGTGSAFQSPLPLTTPDNHSGSVYFMNNDASIANSLTFFSIVSGSTLHMQLRRNATGGFVIKMLGVTAVYDAGVSMPNNTPIRFDYQYTRTSTGDISFSYRIFVTDAEGTVPDAQATITGSTATTVADRLRIGPTGTATIQDMTFDTIRLYDGAVWAEPYGAGTPPVGTPGTVRSLLSNVSNDSIMVMGSTTGATSVRLGVSTSSDMSSPVFSSAVAPNTYNKHLLTVTGLSAGTTYYYQLFDTPAGGSEQAIGNIGKAKTLPAAGSASGFTAVLGSCLKGGSTGTAVNSAAAWGPDLLVHVGDYHYKNVTTETVDAQVAGYDAQTETDAPGLKEFLQITPIFYVRSDHEAGADNGDSDDNLTVVSIAGQNQVFPAQLADTRNPVRARYQTWVAGRVRFIMLDIRTPDRSPGLDPDSSSKTMLGAVQKQWLKDMLLEPEPLKVVISDVAWAGPYSLNNGEDKWWSYATERQEIADFITANNVRVDFWHGDSHFIAADRTHNTWGGFPMLCGSPFYSNGGGRNQEYFDSLYTLDQTSMAQQYLRITFTDDGNTISRTASGWDAINSVERFSQTVTWSVSSPTVTITVWDGTQEVSTVMSLWDGTQELVGETIEVV